MASLTCTKCHETKSTKDFYPRPSIKKGFYSECKACKSKLCSKWQQSNKIKTRQYQREYRKRHPEKIKEVNRKARSKVGYKEKAKADLREWQLANPYKCVFYTTKRLAHIQRATISFDPRIDALYAIAGWLRSKGDNVHVDHIIPLRPADSDAAMGLHVYGNLQILPALENLQKGNR